MQQHWRQPFFIFKIAEHTAEQLSDHFAALKVNSYYRNKVIIITSPDRNISLRNRHSSSSCGCKLWNIASASQCQLKDRQLKYHLTFRRHFVWTQLMCRARCCSKFYACFISIQMAWFHQRLPWSFYSVCFVVWYFWEFIDVPLITSLVSHYGVAVEEISKHIFSLTAYSAVFMCPGYRTSHRYGLSLSALELAPISWHVGLLPPPA